MAGALPSDYPEEWDLPGLLNELSQYYPTKFVAEDLAEASTVEQIQQSVVAEALELYEARDEEIGEELARRLERDIMLQIIDQRWQEHLADMDYLREGINLRAMGNQDPLVAWQREGFAMFSTLMGNINDDYLRYVFHVQVLTEQPAEPDLAQASYVAAEDPVQDDFSAALAQGPVEEQPTVVEETLAPVVKSDHEKVGRNDPCWCGSGKKYKFCHGAN